MAAFPKDNKFDSNEIRVDIVKKSENELPQESKEILSANELVNQNDNFHSESRNEERKRMNYDDPLLTVSVDIDENRHEILNIYANQDINKVTAGFCQKYNLGEDQQNYLNQHIKKSLFHLFNQDSNPEKEENEINQEDIKKIDKEEKTIFNENQSNINSPPKQMSDQKNLDISKKAIKKMSDVKKEEIHKIQADSSQKPNINRKSNQIVSKKGLSKIPVFERLNKNIFYNKKFTKIQDSLSKSISSNSILNDIKKTNLGSKYSKKHILSNTERMYKDGLRKAAEKSKKIEESIEKRKFDELEGATFHPKINYEYKIKKMERSKSVENSLLMFQKKVEGNMKSLIETKEKEILKDCTFHPQINKYYTQTTRSISSHKGNKFTTLYYDSKNKSKELNRLSNSFNNYSFKPSIIKLNPSILTPKVEIFLNKNHLRKTKVQSPLL